MKFSSGAVVAIIVLSLTLTIMASDGYQRRLQSTTISDNIARACTIYCYGPVLEAVQMSGIFNDSKTFVDMPMKYDPEEVFANFTLLPNHLNTTIQLFVNDNFYSAGSDLEDWVPTDYNANPPFLEFISNLNYRTWASDINGLWLLLGKETAPSVAENPQRHSFVPIGYPMVVPGGRFRESYYWDSYWIVRGLLVCNMTDTAWNVISNLIEDVNNFGFVPNGGRIYYLDRSQPPMLTLMFAEYLDYIGWQSPKGVELLRDTLPVLLKEHDWWMDEANKHIVEINTTCTSSTDDILGDDGAKALCSYKLNVYHSNATIPRPESYTEDIATCNETSISDPALCYRNIRSGAETGWDFSSRWLADGFNLSTIDTTNIVPVELNAILYRSELTLAALIQHNFTNGPSRRNVDDVIQHIDDYILNPDDHMVVKYLQFAHNRFAAIQGLLWSSSQSCWLDYNLTSNSQIYSNGGVTEATIASWIPMWAGIPINMATHTSVIDVDTVDWLSHFGDTLQELRESGSWIHRAMHKTKKTTKNLRPHSRRLLEQTTSSLVTSLQNSGLIQAAGVLTTTLQSGQQWDAPNAWPPLVWLTIEGLDILDTPSSISLSNQIAEAWLNTGYLAYMDTGYMYEKYNAFEIGIGGGGGEYTPQIGFGWTNGVALALLIRQYPTGGSSNSVGLSNGAVAGIVVGCVIFFSFAAFYAYYTYRTRAKSPAESFGSDRNYAINTQLVQKH